jgi:hypothetical protein
MVQMLKDDAIRKLIARRDCPVVMWSPGLQPRKLAYFVARLTGQLAVNLENLAALAAAADAVTNVSAPGVRVMIERHFSRIRFSAVGRIGADARQCCQTALPSSTRVATASRS